MTEKERLLVLPDGNPLCTACNADRIHTPAEWKEYHPLAGHGYSPEVGWTHPDLEPRSKRATVVAP